MQKKIVLILGAAGLLGNAMFRLISQSNNFKVYGTIRKKNLKKFFCNSIKNNLLLTGNLEDNAELVKLLDATSPDIVINCLGIPHSSQVDFMRLIEIFSVLPRRLLCLCRSRGIRLIQIGSDGIFSGKRGGYNEDDLPDPVDFYGKAKLLGEVEGSLALTLRTSIVGPELATCNSLLSWFLNQNDSCRCYSRAIFTGFPTVVLAEIVRDFVLPNENLHGIYHVASDPISKFDFLNLVRHQYRKKIKMIPDDSIVINRSLSGLRFQRITGYIPPTWKEMIKKMHKFNFGLG